jgi:predicted AlkP superfamily phosphohydrolase/phosphomutase
LPAPSTDVTITYPKDLLEEIEAEVGEYLLYPDPGQAYSDAGVDAFLDRLYKTTKMRLKVMSYLRAHDEWDFFMMVFNGTDTIQHAMWKYMSPEHPLHDPDKYSKYGDSILNYFRYIDYELGKITDELGEDEVLVLMSDHGFGPFHKFIHVNNWLRKQGWLKIKRSPLATVKTILFDLGFAPMKIYNLLMRMGLGSLKREVVRGQGQGLLKKLFLSFDDVDWFRTAAYSLGNVGQISLNVRGREPHGLIEPGKPYEDLRDEIITRLWQFRDPETGEKVVQEVYRREEIYRGDYVGEASDIIFIPTRMEYFGFGEYEFGSNETIESMKRGISGTHRPYGMFLMYGKPIKQGVWYSGANILDLVPTILFLMSKTVPSDMDGRVLSELIDPELFEILEKGKTETRQTATDKRPENGPPSVDSGLSEEEQQIIAKRLRDLGYVG